MNISERVRAKLADLPDRPGVYFMRDRSGKVIYVGKATSLRNRVRSYFRLSTLRNAPPKLRGLVASIYDLDTVEVRTETEATLLEGQMIKDFRPRFNVDFKDDKRFPLLRVQPSDPFPRFTLVRIRREDGAVYFGPYANSLAARAALEFIERTFGLRRCRPRIPGLEDHRHCLNEVLRHCAAPCIEKCSREAYAERVAEATAFLRGQRPQHLKSLRKAMTDAAAARDYERAAALRDTLQLLNEAVRRTIRDLKGPAGTAEEAKQGMRDLQRALQLPAPPRTIECYDISNIQGELAVGSLVRAVEGMPRRNGYRLFRIRTVQQSDDPAMMAEVLKRRFARAEQPGWIPPDLILVDGGLTQLRAARAALHEADYPQIATAGLAKKDEEIYWGPDGAETVLSLPRDAPALTLLRRIRDEAHRFALSYHRTLRARRIRESALDDIAGIGERRKKALLLHFGSLRRMRQASAEDIAAVPGIGPATGREIYSALHPQTEASRPDPSPAAP